MTEEQQIDLLSFVWQHGLYDAGRLATRDGEPVAVIRPGSRDAGQRPGLFRGAEISIGGKTLAGHVAIHRRASEWGVLRRNNDPEYDGVILNAVADNDRLAYKLDNTLLPAATMKYNLSLERLHETLLASAGNGRCAQEMARMDDIVVKNACTRLMVERLERKCGEILEILRSVNGSWYETFYIVMFRTMGLGSTESKRRYMALAKALPYATVCRECGALPAVEALLFGVAGFLEDHFADDYYLQMQERFAELSGKYNLKALKFGVWSSHGMRPANFPAIRIAQLAKLIDSNEFMFRNVISCETLAQVKKLFDIELRDYWREHFTFDRRSPEANKSLGEMTIDIFIINLVVPILFAFGSFMEEEALRERALDFLDEVAPET
ncbi:MAG: DUF2851 family protein, partial [Rikenellaceae bacterium]|nr:DUF2851 family protein [Rikenellaceae bacterium]